MLEAVVVGSRVAEEVASLHAQQRAACSVPGRSGRQDVDDPRKQVRADAGVVVEVG
jgi:hypothetical protein